MSNKDQLFAPSDTFWTTRFAQNRQSNDDILYLTSQATAYLKRRRLNLVRRGGGLTWCVIVIRKVMLSLCSVFRKFARSSMPSLVMFCMFDSMVIGYIIWLHPPDETTILLRFVSH